MREHDYCCDDCEANNHHCYGLNECMAMFEAQCRGCRIEEQANLDREFDEKLAMGRVS